MSILGSLERHLRSSGFDVIESIVVAGPSESLLCKLVLVRLADEGTLTQVKDAIHILLVGFTCAIIAGSWKLWLTHQNAKGVDR